MAFTIWYLYRYQAQQNKLWTNHFIRFYNERRLVLTAMVVASVSSRQWITAGSRCKLSCTVVVCAWDVAQLFSNSSDVSTKTHTGTYTMSAELNLTVMSGIELKRRRLGRSARSLLELRCTSVSAGWTCSGYETAGGVSILTSVPTAGVVTAVLTNGQRNV